MLAVAASVGLLAAQDHAPTNVEPPANGAGAPANGTVANNSTQLPVETDIGQLQNFLNVPPERLEQMRKAIEYLENMPPGELAALRQRMHSIQELGQEIRGDIRALPKPEDRSILNRYMLTLYPEDIKPLLKNFQDAKDKPDVRKEIVQDMLKKAVANGIKPIDRGTPAGGRGGNRGRGANNDAGRGMVHPETAPAPAATSTTN